MFSLPKKSLLRNLQKLEIELLKIITNLKGKYKLAIISNNFIEVEKKVNKEIGHIFDSLIFSASIGFTKKEKEPFEKALKIFNLKAEECIFIDNSLKNLERPKKLKINVIYYDSSKNKLEFLIDELKKFEIKLN